MSRIFGGLSAPSLRHFQLRVDDTHLFLRGSPNEAPGVLLRGTVVLCNTEPIKVQAVRLYFTGRLRMGFNPVIGNPYRHDKQFLCESTTVHAVTGKESNILPASNHEWRFQFSLPGRLLESLEGHPYSFITYKLKARVERPPFLKDYEERQHIRLIRTVDPLSLELSHTMVVDNLWPEKIKYTFSTPSKTVAYGSAVPSRFILIPLVKGLRIGKVETQLWQKVEYTFARFRSSPSDPANPHEEPKMVCSDVYRMPEDAETEDIEGMDGYQIERTMPLPKNMAIYQQSLDNKYMKIEHELKFIVALHNPAGHTSELRCKLPIRIAMPSVARLNDDNEMVARVSNADASLAMENSAPPVYGEHLYDMIYSDLDLHYLATPSASASATPGNISRSGSTADLTSLDGGVDSQAAANTLYNRLDSLTNPVSSLRNRSRSDQTTEEQTEQSYRAEEPGHTQAQSTSMEYLNRAAQRSNSQTASSDEISRDAVRSGSSGSNTLRPTSGVQTPVHLEYNNDELNRVPSYNTAVNTTTRMLWSADLPTYQTAMSRPASPQN